MAWTNLATPVAQVTAGLSASYTVPAGTTVFVISLAVSGGTNRAGAAPTYNGVAFIQANTVQKAATSPEMNCELWYMLNPPTGSAMTLAFGNTGSLTINYCTFSFTNGGAGTTGYFDLANGGNNTSTNPTISITTTRADALILSVVCSGAQSWTPTAQTGTAINNTDLGNFGFGNQWQVAAAAGAASVGFTLASSEDWGIVAAAFYSSTKGSGTPTQAAATSAGTGSVPFTGTGTPSQAAATSAGTGAETFTGTGTPSQAAATSAGTGAQTFTGTGTPTQTAATGAGTGAESFTGTGTPSQAAATTAGSGGETFTGTSAATQAAQTTAATGTVGSGGAPALWQANDTGTPNNYHSIASGNPRQHVKGINSGDVSVVSCELYQDDFANGNGYVILAENADGSGTVYGTSDLVPMGTSNTAQWWTFNFSTPAVIPAATDFWICPRMTGGFNRVYAYFNPGDLYLPGEGYDIDVNGSHEPSVPGYIEDLAFRLNIATSGGGDVTGTGASTQAAATTAGTGAQTFTGTGATTQAAATSAGTGAQSFTGTGSGTQAAATAAGTGAQSFTGTGAASSSPATSAGTGGETFTGTGSSTQAPATHTGAQDTTVTGTSASTQAAATTAAAGSQTFAGTGASSQAAATTAGTAVETMTGTSAATARPATSSGVGSESFTGTAASQQTAATGSGNAAQSFDATSDVTQAPATGAGTGAQSFAGTSDANQAPATTAGIGVESFTGTGASTQAPATQRASQRRVVTSAEMVARDFLRRGLRRELHRLR